MSFQKARHNGRKTLNAFPESTDGRLDMSDKSIVHSRFCRLGSSESFCRLFSESCSAHSIQLKPGRSVFDALAFR